MNVVMEQPNLNVCGTGVRQDDGGRYCINDLHNASGGEKKHQPSNWLRLDSTKELIEVIQEDKLIRSDQFNDYPSSDMRSPSSELSSLAVKTVEGENAGTFVCEELVYSYAMWISPRFHLQVIRTFRDVVTGKVKKPISSDDKFLEKMVVEAGKRNGYAQSILQEQYGLAPRIPKRVKCSTCQTTFDVDGREDMAKH